MSYYVFKSFKKYDPLEVGTKIKFKKSGKYEYDFKKGDTGLIERVISPYPRATDTIYIVIHTDSSEQMWVTGDDIETFEQLSLLEDGPKERDSEINKLLEDIIKEVDEGLGCNARNYLKDRCIRPQWHDGWHESSKGSKWMGQAEDRYKNHRDW